MSCGLQVYVDGATYFWYDSARGADVLCEISLASLMPKQTLVAGAALVVEGYTVMLNAGGDSFACVRARDSGKSLGDGRRCAVFDVFPLTYVPSKDWYESDAFVEQKGVRAENLASALGLDAKLDNDRILFQCCTQMYGGDLSAYSQVIL